MLPRNLFTFLLISPAIAYAAGQDNEEKLQLSELPAITVAPAITATVNNACNCPTYSCLPARVCIKIQNPR